MSNARQGCPAFGNKTVAMSGELVHTDVALLRLGTARLLRCTRRQKMTQIAPTLCEKKGFRQRSQGAGSPIWRPLVGPEGVERSRVACATESALVVTAPAWGRPTNGRVI